MKHLFQSCSERSWESQIGFGPGTIQSGILNSELREALLLERRQMCKIQVIQNMGKCWRVLQRQLIYGYVAWLRWLWYIYHANASFQHFLWEAAGHPIYALIYSTPLWRHFREAYFYTGELFAIHRVPRSVDSNMTAQCKCASNVIWLAQGPWNLHEECLQYEADAYDTALQSQSNYIIASSCKLRACWHAHMQHEYDVQATSLPIAVWHWSSSSCVLCKLSEISVSDVLLCKRQTQRWTTRLSTFIIKFAVYMHSHIQATESHPVACNMDSVLKMAVIAQCWLIATLCSNTYMSAGRLMQGPQLGNSLKRLLCK